MSQPTPRLEAVLLVEDDELVRHLVSTILQLEGYEVLEASSSSEAHQLSASHGRPIGLLLSDLTLSGVNGADLAAQLIAARPGLKVLFLSGYTAEDATRAGLLPANWPFLQKPFQASRLVAKVREVLDSA